jgi:hypothetical protein
MEKSRSEDVSQYIDRICIIGKQDIAVTEIFTSPFSVCDLENKEWKVVLSNLTDPALNYSSTPIDVVLEVAGTPYHLSLSSGSLAGFASDTITMLYGMHLSKGNYPVKAYFSSVMDDDPMNDTLVKTIVIDPKIEVQLIKTSTSNGCLSGDMPIYQEAVLTNTGNMDLYNIKLVLQIDTGETGDPSYAILTEIYTDTIHTGERIDYSFKSTYKVPWIANYYPRIYASLACDSALATATTAITECVDLEDLYMLSINNPSNINNKDNTGDPIYVNATAGNHSDRNTFADLRITVLVENSQGIQTATFTEMTGAIGISATANHNFTQSYTVPNDTVYYLTVYIDSYENQPFNDTVSITRYTNGVGIASTGTTNAFTLGQNIPNPATNSTRIDYSVPEAGEIVFHVHSITGQLLYSKPIEASRGTHSIELNTSTFAAGVYFYSMEYKGQRLVRQLIISD